VVDPHDELGVFPQVNVWGVGPVSMATLDELRDVGRVAHDSVEDLARRTAELEGRAEDRVADAGAVLVPRREWWPVPQELAARLPETDRLVFHIARLDQGMAARPPGGGLVSRARGWLTRQRRERAAGRLRELLVEFARGGAEAGIDVPGVEPLLEEAAELEARASEHRAALESAQTRLHQLDHEIGLRGEALQHLGFDSLHYAAHFRAHGLPVVQSPVELPAGEAAHLVVEAGLAHQVVVRSQDAASQGASVTHTGIHHWIGAFRRGAPPVSMERPIDSGVLVVTDQRLLFAGAGGSLSAPLGGVLAMDVYDAALAVLQLGRDAGDVFLVRQPGLVAFYVNWVLEGVNPPGPRR